MVSYGEITIEVVNMYIDPESDELVAVASFDGNRNEMREPLESHFPFEGDVWVTDRLNIRIEGDGFSRISPVPDDLLPPDYESE